MKNKAKWLIGLLIVLLYSDLGFSQSLPDESKWSNNLIIDNSFWTESNKNIELRKHKGIGFLYPYNLPDANGEAIALFRTYSTSINNGFSIIKVKSLNKSVKALRGNVKFSGSDIALAKDTLIIAAYYSKTKPPVLISNLNKGLIPDGAAVVRISEPMTQFEHFTIDLSESINEEERKYLIVQLIIKSGSDDSYYWGYSNAVIDDLKFVTKQNL